MSRVNKSSSCCWPAIAVQENMEVDFSWFFGLGKFNFTLFDLINSFSGVTGKLGIQNLVDLKALLTLAIG